MGKCKESVKRQMSFIAVFLKDQSVKPRERKVQQARQQFRIQWINFSFVYGEGKATLQETLQKKEQSLKQRLNVRIQKSGPN